MTAGLSIMTEDFLKKEEFRFSLFQTCTFQTVSLHNKRMTLPRYQDGLQLLSRVSHFGPGRLRLLVRERFVVLCFASWFSVLVVSPESVASAEINAWRITAMEITPFIFSSCCRTTRLHRPAGLSCVACVRQRRGYCAVQSWLQRAEHQLVVGVRTGE